MPSKFAGHTKGPWGCRANPDHDLHSHWIDGPPRGDAVRGAPIAEVRDYHNGESESNATLIAAAPDLLAACEAISGLLRAIGCEGTEKYGDDCRVCAALALANRVLGK